MLEERIMSDYKEALKAKEQLRSQSLSFLRAQLKNSAIEKKADKLQDSDVIVVIKKLIKQRQDSIAQFKKGQREDLVQKEEGELAILKSYLPQELPGEEVAGIVDEVISALGAATMKDMGRVMKEVMAKTGGAADNKMVSDIVRSRLQPKVEGKE